MKNIKVLLAEDDFDFGSILKQYLEINQFNVVWAKDGNEALEIFKKVNSSERDLFNICVFDVMMNGIDGFTLASKIIDLNPEIPFIFLTAKKLKEDKIRGLKLGADDYIVKPFDADILVLRLRNILKRVQRLNTNSNNTQNYNIGKYVFDSKNHLLDIDGDITPLTIKETTLIEYLVNNKNELIKREDLLNSIWGSDDFFSGRSMDVFISRLRKYFKSDTSISIEVTRGVGLTFKVVEK
jgi:DNA-binding response OmpR family regulator